MEVANISSRGGVAGEGGRLDMKVKVQETPEDNREQGGNKCICQTPINTQSRTRGQQKYI